MAVMLQKTPTSLVYLSAAELGITERERAGLIEVRDDLASGRVKHYSGDEWNHGPDEVDAPLFDMRNWVNKTDCGTAHCIGGFMQARQTFAEPGYSSPLRLLFYPGYCNGAYEAAPIQAVRAIDHFLSGAGAECWPMALADLPVA